VAGTFATNEINGHINMSFEQSGMRADAFQILPGMTCHVLPISGIYQ